MTFEESLKATVTREQAKQCILEHNAYWEDFIAEKGDKPFYKGKTVLFWLGY